MIYCVFYVILFSLFLFYTSLFLFIDYDVLTKATTPFGIVAYRKVFGECYPNSFFKSSNDS